MGAFYETIPDSLIKWILTQHVFWIATAPLSGNGHVNLSPKGGKYFGVPDNKTFWYQDLSGSGNETIAHLYEPGNARICVTFNAFDGPPKIVRLWGHGRVLEYDSLEFDAHIKEHKVTPLPGCRSIIVVDVHQVGSSCGFSVPYFDFKEYRPILNNLWEKKKKEYDEGDESKSMDRYWAYKSAYSMDGLPGMRRGLDTGKKFQIEPIKKMVGPLAPKNGTRGGVDGFTLEQVVVVFIVAFIAGIMAVMLSPSLVRKVIVSTPEKQQGLAGLLRSLR